jgi:3-hydroxyethyl bacteriochlorophyllide a dehydrogenase
VKTEAIIFPEPNQITFGEVEVADPEAGDAVVRTRYTVLSTGTDTRTLRGGQTDQFPLVPGYSSVGVVEEVLGEAETVREGDLVFAGGPRELTGINSCWGAQIRHCVKPASSLMPLDERRPLEEYAFTKVAAIALHGVCRSSSRPADRVVVLGQGLIGQLHARIQVAWGRKVVVSDILPGRLERSAAADVLRTVDARDEDVVSVVHGMWPDGCDVAVEATARQECLEQCVELLCSKPWGTHDRMPVLVVQSSFPAEINFHYSDIFMKEVAVIPTRDCGPRDMWAASRMIGSGLLRVDDLITSRARPEDAAAAFDDLLSNPNEHFTCVFEW